jgi:hypothetical protein
MNKLEAQLLTKALHPLQRLTDPLNLAIADEVGAVPFAAMVQEEAELALFQFRAALYEIESWSSRPAYVAAGTETGVVELDDLLSGA